jgi:hypothetical protein
MEMQYFMGLAIATAAPALAMAVSRYEPDNQSKYLLTVAIYLSAGAAILAKLM